VTSEATPLRDHPTPQIRAAAARRIERHVLAVAAVVLLHLVLLGGGAAASAVVAARGPGAWLPRQPLLVSLVALLLAHWSLAAIWWARSAWPAHLKTLLAVVWCAGLWLLLIGRLQTVRLEPIAAAGWATSIGLQVVITALAAAALESMKAGRRAARASRFTIMQLLIWTTLVAVLLGVGRQWAAERGWTIAGMLDWQFWRQVQAGGLVNALLAIGLISSLRLPRTWHGRSAACLATIYFVSLCAPIMMWLAFGGLTGAQLAALVWLWGAEGFFVAVTLVPLTIVAERPAVGGPALA